MDFTNVKNVIRDRIGRVILGPLNELADDNVTDVVTTIGSFAIKAIRGKFTRSITFTIGRRYADKWMEEALYGILYKYNNIKKKSNLELTNVDSDHDGSSMYYRLGEGTHGLKYRSYEILLVVENLTSSTGGRLMDSYRKYTVLTYNLDPNFMLNFEKDMIIHRNSILRIKADSQTVNVYKDMHENDGYTYWDKALCIPKRRLNTMYLPKDIKSTIVDTVNHFFASKEYYKKHGLVHNLKVLLHGAPGTGKDSIAKTIASEWNRNVYYVTGGKGGRFIPNAISSNSSDIISPLFLISDIDKYPFLINDTEIVLDSEEVGKEDKIGYKQSFGHMINALDGVMSGEHRIIIMTTNHIEKFSPVFIRPGRVDLMLEIGYVTPEVFRKWTYDFYNGKILPPDIQLKSPKLTIADMQFDKVFLKLPVNEFIEKHIKGGYKE